MTDILVIGGGIAGLSAGAALSTLGSVTLLEREAALAHHASGRSAALFEEHYGKPSVVELNRASHARHREAGVLSPRGLLLVAAPGEEKAFEADLALMPLPEIARTEAQALCPILSPAITRTAYDPGAWDIDTDRLIQGFARTIRAAGGSVLTGAEVTAIRRTPTGWAVTAGGVVHEAALLVDAAGAWADRIAALAGIAPLGLRPLRRSMARIAAPAGMDPAPWPMLLGAGESWYMKPDAGALIVSPAEEDPVDPHDAWAEDMVLAEGLARYEAHVTAPVTRMIANWAGLRTFAPDRELVLGPDPSDPAFLWCAGQGGYGFQTCHAVADLLSDLVAGRAPALGADFAARLSPARFR